MTLELNTKFIISEFLNNQLSEETFIGMCERGMLDMNLVDAFTEGKLNFDWDSLDDYDVNGSKDPTIKGNNESKGKSFARKALDTYLEKSNKIGLKNNTNPSVKDTNSDIQAAKAVNSKYAASVNDIPQDNI